MKNRRNFLLTVTSGLVALAVVITPVIAEEFFGFITRSTPKAKSSQSSRKTTQRSR